MTFWKRTYTRRDFLESSAVAGALALAGGLRIPISLAQSGISQNETAGLGPFIQINQEGVTLVCHRAEMGQGVRTAMVMLLAEELDVPLTGIKVIQADGDEIYGDQSTDGSKSVRLNYDALRVAGAKARALLLAAAARRAKTKPKFLKTTEGRVIDSRTGKSWTYSELVADAAKLHLLENPQPRGTTRLLRKPQKSLDLKPILKGQAVFGMDVRLPGMVFASIVRAPTPVTRLEKSESEKTLRQPGVLQVLELEPIGKPVAYTNAGVAVIGEHTWAALKGRELLKVQWKRNSEVSSFDLQKEMDALLTKPGKIFRSDGSFATLEGAAFAQTYRTPYWVHSPIEPLVATARVDVADGKVSGCEVWAPLQDPGLVQREICTFLDLKSAQVKVHVTFLGGAFGRKSQPDFVLEAVALAKKTKRPVQVVWSREDEIRHGFYHAQSVQRLEARWKEGRIVGWKHHSVFPTIMRLFDPAVMDVDAAELTMGASNMPYSIPHVEIMGSRSNTPVRIGWMRSVCYAFNVFGAQSFVDECAYFAKKDPHLFRLELLKPYGRVGWDKDAAYGLDTGRLAAVQEKVAQRIGWDKKRVAGRGVGIASHLGFQSYCALALEVEMVKEKPHVLRAVCAIDCGRYVNPDTIRAQMEGSIVFGLSQALYGRITLENGAVVQSGFQDARILDISESPAIEVILVDNEHPPGGVGEPMVPLVAPALCNAIFAASGRRIRELPVL